CPARGDGALPPTLPGAKPEVSPMFLMRPLAGLLAVAAVAAGLTLLRAPAQTVRSTAARPVLHPSTAQHKVAIQVDQNDQAVMELALNNAKNIGEHYGARGESVAIEIVAYGPGLHMLRNDTSPVKERIAVMSLEYPGLQFTAC